MPVALVVVLSLLIPAALGMTLPKSICLSPSVHLFYVRFFKTSTIVCMYVCLVISKVHVCFLRTAGVICEDLSQNKCAFAVSSSSKRCVLESYQRSGAPTEYKCRSSEVGVSRIQDHIETEECVRACGVDRNSVGISSDLLLETQFQDKLCSPECFQNCPNIIDLYYNLAAGEGNCLFYV